MRQIIFPLLLLFFASCDDVLNRKPASTSEKEINRTNFQVKYYSDWTIDSTDENFDLDSYLTIDSRNNGFISFFIFSVPFDEKEFVESQIENRLKEDIKKGKVTRFANWGRYKGYGAKIKGKILGMLNGEINMFTHSCDSCTFSTTYQYFDSDKESDLPGFKLIESTFRMK